MSYTGSITIVDENGDVAFEQELSQDQIISALIDAIPGEENPAADDVEDKPTGKRTLTCATCGKSGHTRRTCGRADNEASTDGKPCCGSKGSRHFKTCQQAGSELHGQSVNRRTVDNRIPFSEPTFNAVKTLLEDRGRTVDDISAEKGLDLQEVRRCNLANDFQDYLTIA